MTDVEIIYLKRGNSKENYLSPNVSIHPPKGCETKINPCNEVIKNKIEIKKDFLNPKKTAYLFICFVIIGIVLTSSFNAGFIPVKGLLEIKEPIGTITEINIEEAVETYSLPIDSIPTFENIKYKIYGSNQGKAVIKADYQDELTRDGYELKYSGTQNIRGVDLSYCGFIKGLTAVVIITTTDKTYVDDFETLVLYSTGSIFDYAKLLKDNTGFLKL